MSKAKVNPVPWQAPIPPTDAPWSFWKASVFLGPATQTKGGVSFSLSSSHEAPYEIASMLDLESYMHWCGKAEWSSLEATAISFGKDPEHLPEDSDLPKYFRMYFLDRKRFIENAQGSGELRDRITPADFVAWAERTDLSIPKELTKAVAAYQEGLSKLQKRCSELEEVNAKSAVTISQLKLRIRNSDQQHDDIGRSRMMAHFLIMAMAIHKYGYQPLEHQTHSSVTSIHAALKALDFDRSEQRVRDYLNEATKTIVAQKGESAFSKFKTELANFKRQGRSI